MRLLHRVLPPRLYPVSKGILPTPRTFMLHGNADRQRISQYPPFSPGEEFADAMSNGNDDGHASSRSRPSQYPSSRNIQVHLRTPACTVCRIRKTKVGERDVIKTRQADSTARKCSRDIPSCTHCSKGGHTCDYQSESSRRVKHFLPCYTCCEQGRTVSFVLYPP